MLATQQKAQTGQPRRARKLSVRRDDQVMVISGKDRGKRGKVLRVDRESGRVVVEGINMVHRHTKPTQKVMQGGIIEQEGPISASNVMLVCGSCHEATRVGHMVDDSGRRRRKCMRCGRPIGA